jgi:hypothetical protein
VWEEGDAKVTNLRTEEYDSAICVATATTNFTAVWLTKKEN